MNALQELINRRTALALQTEIPDMSAYALEWSKLAREFDALGAEHNSNLCRSKAEHYGELVEGAYTRTLDGSFAELRTDETQGSYTLQKCFRWSRESD